MKESMYENTKTVSHQNNAIGAGGEDPGRSIFSEQTAGLWDTSCKQDDDELC